MIEFLSNLSYWHWWIFAVFMMFFELLLPGAAFLWLGASAAIVGLIALIIPGIPWEVELLVFAALSVGTVLLWLKYLRKSPITTDRPHLNRRGSQYIGQTYKLDQAIVNGRGRIRIGDTFWVVAGPDAPQGTAVKAVELKGTVLRVEIVSSVISDAGSAEDKPA